MNQKMDRSKFFAVVGMIAALFSLTMNCSGGLVPVNLNGSNSSENVPGVDPNFALQCNSKAEVESGTLVSDADLVKAAGRIGASRDGGGFLDEEGNLYFVVRDVAGRADPGVKYKWFSFEPNDWSPAKYFARTGRTQCGVTLENKVKCFNKTTVTWAEVTELEGSVQVAGFSRNLCGLKADGKATCLNEYMTANPLPVDQTIKLLTATWILTTDGKQFRSEHALAQTATPDLYKNDILNAGAPINLDLKDVNLCDTKFKNYSYTEGASYSIFACGVSEYGRLYCTYHPSLYAAKLETAIISSSGKYTSQFSSIDNANRYLAVRIFSSGLICGIRADSKVSCFSPGFGRAELNSAQNLGLTVQAKTLGKFPNPSGVSEIVVQTKRSCALNAGKIQCFENPILDPFTAVERPMFLLDPDTTYVRLYKGYYESNVRQRLCGLTTTGLVKCQVVTQSDPATFVEKNEMAVVDRGTLYNGIVVAQGDSCGWSSSNSVRCVDAFGTTPPTEQHVGKVIGLTLDVFFLNDGTFYKLGSNRVGSMVDSAGVAFTYARNAPGYTNVIEGTDGKLRVIEYSTFIEIQPTELAKLANFKPFGGIQYFNKATNVCAYIYASGTSATVMTRSCDVFDFEGVKSEWVPEYIDSQVYLRDDGALFTPTGSTEVYFIPPQVIRPAAL